jgi:ketosteroid isomerase-like protein
MKRRSILLVPVCLTLVCVLADFVSAQTDADAATRVRILALEKLWFECFAAKDTRAIDSILDSSVLLVNFDGSAQTKGDYLASLKVQFAQPDPAESQTLPESMSVKVFGKTVIATGVYRVKGVQHGKPYLRRERFVDTWKYRAGMWLIVGTQATPVLH